MYETTDEWLSQARHAMANYVTLRHQINQLEAQAAAQLAVVVDAYRWPDNLPQPTRPDTYRADLIENQPYGEDLTSELAVAHRTSEAAMEYLVRDITILTRRLPRCWAKITTGQAPLWQARKIVEAGIGMSVHAWPVLDAMVADGLGVLGPRRLCQLIDAAARRANPDRVERITTVRTRYVATGGDDIDSLTGWVSAKVDRADALYLDATVQLIADQLAAGGDTRTKDERRAAALGLLANPAAAIQLTGIHTSRGMNPVPDTGEDKQTFVEHAKTLIPVFTPRVQVYLHLTGPFWADTDGVARVETLGPLLTHQVAKITKGCHVRLTPVIHPDRSQIVVDAYEIPLWMRDHVTLRDAYSIFPWSSIEARLLDLDHTTPYIPGAPGQTRPGNLGPLHRHAHRVKTHAGWHLTQPQPGRFHWITPAGQHITVDWNGTHPVSDRE